MAKSDRLVLLTNDDGFGSRGLVALEEALRSLVNVVVVAPYEEKSAVSHGVTIHHPLRLVEMGEDRYALTGTPADCVIFALTKLLPRTPNLVISGINAGPNLGDDIHYSGTVAGAREASFHLIPSIAVSLVSLRDGADFEPAAAIARQLVEEMSPEMMPAGTFWNVNVPAGKLCGFKFTRQGSRLSWGNVEEKEDPRGRKYYWIGRDDAQWSPQPDTDYQAVEDHLVSITPLQHDHTDYRSLRQLLEQSEPKS
ncbi:MAG: 5'/3'-nucleotidase SurE [Acidobacteria bacterium]|nr:MAG: 5'/3'-nucleotidase SurE [Acidobacteriota bacterium]